MILFDGIDPIAPWPTIVGSNRKDVASPGRRLSSLCTVEGKANVGNDSKAAQLATLFRQ